MTTNEELRAAADDFTDSVLHGRHQLASMLDNDQTNAVLGLYDDTIGAVLSTVRSDDGELVQAVKELSESGKAGFITCESYGLTQTYKVMAKFRTLEEAQRFYSALAAIGKLIEALGGR